MGDQSPGCPGGKSLDKPLVNEYKDLINRSPSTRAAVDSLILFAEKVVYNDLTCEQLISHTNINEEFATEFNDAVAEGFLVNPENDLKVKISKKVNILSDLVLKKAEPINNKKPNKSLVNKDPNEWNKDKTYESNTLLPQKMDTSDKQDKMHLINNVTENRYENTDFGGYRIYIESEDKNIGYLLERYSIKIHNTIQVILKGEGKTD
ncbi:hypothetical protein JTB14_001163 [Gonioctena quinquepunctata]|nr:hypothetical protein JTB14_001163 [Gonioctena quinquepunctata]